MYIYRNNSLTCENMPNVGSELPPKSKPRFIHILNKPIARLLSTSPSSLSPWKACIYRCTMGLKSMRSMTRSRRGEDEEGGEEGEEEEDKGAEEEEDDEEEGGL